MRRLWLLWLLLLALAVTGCSVGGIGSEEAEVEGVRAERTPSPSGTDLRTVRPDEGDDTATPESTPTSTPDGSRTAAEDPAATSPPAETAEPAAETEAPTDTGTVAAADDPDGANDGGSDTAADDGGEEPPPDQPAEDDQPADDQGADDQDPDDQDGAEPSPSPSPSPTSPRLASRDGWSYVTWRPQDREQNSEQGQGEDDTGDDQWWTEVSAALPVERDDPEGAESHPVRVRLQPAGGSTTGDRVRDGRCRAWILAPDDHGWRVRGRLSVALVAGNTAKIIERYDLDTTVGAGERFELVPTTPQSVDAAEGRDVTCEVTFDTR